MTNALVNYQPQNLSQLEAFADRLAKSAIVPQPYRNKPNDVMAACLWGWETAELPPMIALACIDVIQGRAAYKSEALAGIALKRGLIQDMEESFEGEPGTDAYTAVCIVTKPNGKKVTSRFSVGDAKKAGLYGKDNWSKWLDRMLRARARGFAIRDSAPHAFLGYTAEEVRDFDDAPQPHSGPERAKDVTPAPDVRAAYAIATEDNARDGLERHLPENQPGFAQSAAEPERPAAPRQPITVRDARGRPWSTCANLKEALIAYGEVKKAEHEDKPGVAVQNLDILKRALALATNGNKAKLAAEIQAAEAVLESRADQAQPPADEPAGDGEFGDEPLLDLPMSGPAREAVDALRGGLGHAR